MRGRAYRAGVREDAAPSWVEIAPGIGVHESALRFAFSRSSGPGGQNVNKRSTKSEMRIALADLPISPGARRRVESLAGTVGARVTDEGDLLIISDESRSQGMNRSACIDRLRELVVAALPEPKLRRKTKPTKASRRRRIEGKKRRGDVKRGRRASGED